MSSVRVQVINDNIAEGSEHFNLALTVPSSLGPTIIAGSRDRVVGVITESNGTCRLILYSSLFMC